MTDVAAASVAPVATQEAVDRRRELALDALAVGVLLFAFVVAVVGRWHAGPSPMDEGLLLVVPDWMLHGAVPFRDFDYPYGPGNLWILAGAYKILGTSVATERLVGSAYIAGTVFGVFGLARPWGRWVALTSALIVVVISTFGLAAFAFVGAMAFAVLALVAGLAARNEQRERRARALAILSGALFGVALLHRPDLVLAVLPTVAVITWRAPAARVKPLLVSLTAVTSLYLVTLVTAGVSPPFRALVLNPLFHMPAGRSLPLPPAWDHYANTGQAVLDLTLVRWPWATLSGPNQLFIWFFATLASVALVLVVAVRSLRRRPANPRGRALLAMGFLGLGALTQVVQRADSLHLAEVGCVSIAFVPAALCELFRDLRWAPERWRTTWATVLACALPVGFLVFVLPNIAIRNYVGTVQTAFGGEDDSATLRHRGRETQVPADDLRRLQRLVALVDRRTHPGQRVFVGPKDLRKTPYNDAWLYYMFPDLTPGTFYVLMDPGVANAPGSRMADDLRKSDVAILTTTWDSWYEPNTSVDPGSPRPNQVLRKHFCEVASFGDRYYVYERCR